MYARRYPLPGAGKLEGLARAKEAIAGVFQVRILELPFPVHWESLDRPSMFGDMPNARVTQASTRSSEAPARFSVSPSSYAACHL